MTARPLVVIPALNEGRSVGGVVRAVRAEGFDVVVVDDGSSDDTGARAREAGATVLTLPVNMGVGGALRCGFRFAVERGYGAAIQCDADGQHEPRLLRALVDTAERDGAHLVIGSRFLKGASRPPTGAARRLAMWYLARIASAAAGTRLTDVTSGFRLFQGELLVNFARNFPSYWLGDTFEATYVAGRAGYRVVEIPVSMQEREHGTSSASNRAAVIMIAKALLTALLGLHMPLPRPRTATRSRP